MYLWEKNAKYTNNILLIIAFFVFLIVSYVILKKNKVIEKLTPENTKALSDYLNNNSPILDHGYNIIRNGEIVYKNNEKSNLEIWSGGHRDILNKHLLEYSKLYPDTNYILYLCDNADKLVDISIKLLDKFPNTIILTPSNSIQKLNKCIRLLPTPYTEEFDKRLEYEFTTTSWKDKIPKIVWRGTTSSIYCKNTNICNGVRLTLYDKLKNRSDISNVAFNNNHYKKEEYDTKIEPKLSIKEQSEYKIILCLDGWGWPGNINWILQSGSVPVIISEYHTGFFHKLIPDVDYISAKTDGSDIIQKIEYILNPQNSEKMEKLIENAKNKANHIFDKNVLLEDLKNTMNNYRHS
jgi:hypothetical protein